MSGEGGADQGQEGAAAPPAEKCVREGVCVCACVFVGDYIHMYVRMCVLCFAEDEMYAQLWKEDMLAKEKREEMEAVLQIERNREMLKVSVQRQTVFVSIQDNMHYNA